MSEQNLLVTRRNFIISSAAAATSLVFPSLILGASRHEKRLQLFNTHTGEWFKDIFWADGKPIQEQLKKLDRFLRDPSNGKVHKIEPKLFELMAFLQHNLAPKRAFEIISGYRSPELNNRLRAKNGGVAQKSKHLEGKAVDLRLSGVPLAALRKAAMSQKKGGVGYYPRSNFVHIDIRPKPCCW